MSVFLFFWAWTVLNVIIGGPQYAGTHFKERVRLRKLRPTVFCRRAYSLEAWKQVREIQTLIRNLIILANVSFDISRFWAVIHVSSFGVNCSPRGDCICVNCRLTSRSNLMQVLVLGNGHLRGQVRFFFFFWTPFSLSSSQKVAIWYTLKIKQPNEHPLRFLIPDFWAGVVEIFHGPILTIGRLGFFILFICLFVYCSTVLCHMRSGTPEPERLLQAQRQRKGQRRSMWGSITARRHPALPSCRMHPLHLGRRRMERSESELFFRLCVWDTFQSILCSWNPLEWYSLPSCFRFFIFLFLNTMQANLNLELCGFGLLPHLCHNIPSMLS